MREKTKGGKGKTQTVLACSDLSCGEAMFVVAFMDCCQHLIRMK